LEKEGYEVIDHGTHSLDSVDYPDFVHPVASMVDAGEVDKGILICGSGNGVCMTGNKHENVRAALSWKREIAALARQHNDANVICIPARFVQ
jgi:ribose 5-phosphate isomerase B